VSDNIEQLKSLFMETVQEEHSQALEAACCLLFGLTNFVSDFIYIKDTDGKYLVTNEAHKNFLHKEPTGLTVADLFPKELAEQYAADDKLAIRTDTPIIRKEIHHNNLVEPREVVTVKVPIHDVNKKITGLFCLSYPNERTDRKT